MNTIKISENITVLRKQKGMTQDDLAKKLNVSNQAVSKWEAGKCCPDIELLPVLARVFEVSIDELLLGEAKSSIDEDDVIMLQVMKMVQDNQRIYTALLQRKFGIGYNRAKRIIDDVNIIIAKM